MTSSASCRFRVTSQSARYSGRCQASKNSSKSGAGSARRGAAGGGAGATSVAFLMVAP